MNSPIATSSPDELSKSLSRSMLWRRWLIAVATCVVVLWMIHPWLLRQIGNALIHTDPLQPVSLLIVLDGEPGYRLAAEQLQRGQAHSLLIHDRVHSRVVTLGVLPPHLERSRKMVTDLSIPLKAVREHPVAVDHIEELLQVAVDEHSRGHTVGVIVTQWRSSLIRGKLADLVDGDEAQRPLVFGLSDPEVSPETWWQTRHGVRLVCDQWMRLGSSWFSEEELDGNIRTVEDFRRAGIAN